MDTYHYKLVQPDGTTIWRQHGVVQVINGRLYFYDGNMDDFFLPFVGKHVEIVLTPTDYDWPIDPKIQPLVEAMQRIGLQTFASCEGHIDFYPPPYPWVAFHKTDTPPAPPDGYGWMLDTGPYGDYSVWRTINKATTETELTKLQESISELAKALS